MIHTIIRSPASQVLTLTPGHTSTLFVALLAGVLAFSYDKWLRRHLGRVTHFFDLLAVLLALVCGVALAAACPATGRSAVREDRVGVELRRECPR